MALPRRSAQRPGRTALVLFGLALVAFAVPVLVYAMAATDHGEDLRDGSAVVQVSGGRTWGIYFNDADNSGYSESCSVTDEDGRDVELRDPRATLSSSETETLDYVFTTPSGGKFEVACSADGATARTGPVGNLTLLVVGVVVAAGFGIAGLVAGNAWLTRRTTASAPPASDPIRTARP